MRGTAVPVAVEEGSGKGVRVAGGGVSLGVADISIGNGVGLVLMSRVNMTNRAMTKITIRARMSRGQ